MLVRSRQISEKLRSKIASSLIRRQCNVKKAEQNRDDNFTAPIFYRYCHQPHTLQFSARIAALVDTWQLDHDGAISARALRLQECTCHAVSRAERHIADADKLAAGVDDAKNLVDDALE